MFFRRRRPRLFTMWRLILTAIGLGFMFGRGSALMGKEQKATREMYKLKAKLFWEKLKDAFQVFKVEKTEQKIPQ
jgi:hypothetical protein